MRDSFESAPWIGCPDCMAPLPFGTGDAFAAYFRREQLLCPDCHSPLDWFVAARKWVESGFAFGHVMAMAGASTKHMSVPLAPDQVALVDLTATGVPSDAEVVSLNMTAQGAGVLPVILHGNSAIRDPMPPKFHVRGLPLPYPPGEAGGPGGAVRIFVSAVWFVRHGDDTVVRHLVDAARHFEAKRLDGVVVPANIAAEAAITPVVARALAPYASKRHLDGFLRNAATYGHQLNVMLSLLADLYRIPRMPEALRISLDGLRKARNDVGHSGRCLPQTTAEAADKLTAALFGVRYAAFMESELDARQPTTQPG